MRSHGIRIQGKPATKGSYVAITRADGGSFLKNDSLGLKGWTEEIRYLASAEMRGVPPYTAVYLEIVIYRKRPQKKHPKYPNMRPDPDKVARAVMDALTGIAYVDDSNVIIVLARKAWDDSHHTEILWSQMV